MTIDVVKAWARSKFDTLTATSALTEDFWEALPEWGQEFDVHFYIEDDGTQGFVIYPVVKGSTDTMNALYGFYQSTAQFLEPANFQIQGGDDVKVTHAVIEYNDNQPDNLLVKLYDAQNNAVAGLTLNTYNASKLVIALEGGIEAEF